MPLIATRGAASAQGFGEFAQTAAPVYIEDVFSTYLYTGTGASNTINNGIDLSTKGGLAWFKDRGATAYYHNLIDTARGVDKILFTNLTNANFTSANSLTSFNSNGFTLGTDAASGGTNSSGVNYVSWTFREQPKFFDIVTYTGNGNNNRAISHNLGSAPGCVIIKSTSNAQNWPVFHRSTGANTIFWLNATNANTSNTGYFPTAPDSTSFYVGTDTDVNQNGYTYVAYLFAHNAGGFGLTGSDNVITCGSFTTNGSGGTSEINLGYEPQWMLIKNTSAAEKWYMWDIMRGWSQSSSPFLSPNTSAAETSAVPGGEGYGKPTATGFSFDNFALGASNTYIYIAIRRGPMKTPTSGTQVFYSGSIPAAGSVTWSSNVLTDFVVPCELTGASYNFYSSDRLRGARYLQTSSSGSEQGASVAFDVQNGLRTTSSWYTNGNFAWFFRRFPGFFDVVCYTGTDTGSQSISHNLGVAPELMIVKRRNGAQDWYVYSATIGNTRTLFLNLTDAQASPSTGYWNNTSPTSTQFTVGSQINVGNTYVAYLFASVSGVSKVGSYTGTGALQTVNCGFTGGARFVLIKRTDSTGDWWVYDSARGISSANDPYIYWNNAVAGQVTNTNYVDTTSVGFQVTAAAPAGLNANGGTYIFLAIA